MDNYSIFSNVTLMPDTESEKPKKKIFVFFLPNITRYNSYALCIKRQNKHTEIVHLVWVLFN